MLVVTASSAADIAATDTSFRPVPRGASREASGEGEGRKGLPFVAGSGGAWGAAEQRSIRFVVEAAGGADPEERRGGRPCASAPARGFLWGGCARTIGKRKVRGIQGKPSM
ncbi:hypothetical protein GCM10023335_32980 [Streptomyces siamensis]|uniref:Uncharacterized protein n=1 Tax=Streptomyces siamensis TaxID=1274986 RepID=A0ABP9IVR2_9ACTN